MKKQLILTITAVLTSFFGVIGQEALLSFPHSRVVKENYYNEISTVDHVVYYNGKDIVNEKVDCHCQSDGQSKIVIELAKSFGSVPNGVTSVHESKVILVLDLILVSDAFLQVKTNSVLPPRTYSLSKMNVQLSNLDYNHLDQLHGVVKLELPNEMGFADHERYVHFRFKCHEGLVAQIK